MTKRMRSKGVALSAAFLALPLTLAACESEDEAQAYCADEQGYVLPEDRCDGDDAGTFIYVYPAGVGRTSYGVGDKLHVVSGNHTRVASTDSAARSKAGVPARGGFGGNGAKFSSGG